MTFPTAAYKHSSSSYFEATEDVPEEKKQKCFNASTSRCKNKHNLVAFTNLKDTKPQKLGKYIASAKNCKLCSVHYTANLVAACFDEVYGTPPKRSHDPQLIKNFPNKQIHLALSFLICGKSSCLFVCWQLRSITQACKMIPPDCFLHSGRTLNQMRVLLFGLHISTAGLNWDLQEKMAHQSWPVYSLGSVGKVLISLDSRECTARNTLVFPQVMQAAMPRCKGLKWARMAGGCSTDRRKLRISSPVQMLEKFAWLGCSWKKKKIILW